MCEIVRARWPGAHFTFLFFGFSANLIVTSMLILGGAARSRRGHPPARRGSGDARPSPRPSHARRP